MTRQIVSMYKPVVLLCVLILLYSQLVVQNDKNPLVAWNILVYKQEDGVRRHIRTHAHRERNEPRHVMAIGANTRSI